MTLSIADLAAVHQKIKEKRAALAAEFARVDAELKEEQATLRRHLLTLLNATGGTSVNTPAGTVYRRKVVKAAGADWAAIWEWQKQNDAPDLMQKRLNVGFIEDYIEAHGKPENPAHVANEGTPHEVWWDGSAWVQPWTAIPPGINLHTEFDVSIRKS